MSKKINIAVLFGGKSVEHEVSLQSGLSITRALNHAKYNVYMIGIDKQGHWHAYDERCAFINPEDPEAISLGEKSHPINPFDLKHIDIIFPALHGPLGEDGTVQGLARLADIPFVGSDVIGSSIGMDKDVMKRLVKEAGINVAKSLTFFAHETIDIKDLAYPLFVKPANGGSSIGISKIYEPSQLACATEEAFRFSHKILIEETVIGRELQCGIMGDQWPTISLPCEIIPKGEFHTYTSKYIDKAAAEILYPAPLDSEDLSHVQMTSLKIYKTLCCEGFARVDLFMADEGKVYFNEINTLPGLTNMSPYAKMWASSGVGFDELIDHLIELALRRHEREKQLVTQMEWNKR